MPLRVPSFQPISALARRGNHRPAATSIEMAPGTAATRWRLLTTAGCTGSRVQVATAPIDSPHFLDGRSLGVMLYEIPTRPSEITDGLAHTVVVAECAGRDHYQQSEWANGHNCFAQHQDVGINRTSENEVHSDHPELAGVVFCDGHVQFLVGSMAQPALLALLTRAGEEVSDEP